MRQHYFQHGYLSLLTLIKLKKIVSLDKSLNLQSVIFEGVISRPVSQVENTAISVCVLFCSENEPDANHKISLQANY